MKVRDVILEVEGNDITSSSGLLEIIASHKPGNELDMIVQRDGKKRSVSIKLQEAKSIRTTDS
jgi:S1-C subfamily serine protease